MTLGDASCAIFVIFGGICNAGFELYKVAFSYSIFTLVTALILNVLWAFNLERFHKAKSGGPKAANAEELSRSAEKLSNSTRVRDYATGKTGLDRLKSQVLTMEYGATGTPF
eukprot:SAG31_NODE_4385_length_3281_cov_137.482401_5_plen_112_part_00